MIAVHRIEYRGFSSIDFDLVCCLAFDSDNGESDAFLNREAIASEHYRGELKRVHQYKYTDVFAPQFTFIKKDHSDFTFAEQRKVLSWLTSSITPSFLTVYYDDSNVISFECLGGFTEINTYKIANNRTVGITAVFESVTPWAFSPLRTITKDVSNPLDNTITINLETDDPHSAIYPRITIQQDNDTNVIEIDHPMTDADNWVEGSVYQYIGNGRYYWIDVNGVKHSASSTNDSGFDATSVSISNTYTNYAGQVSVFDALIKNNIKGETVVLDGANKVVSSSRTSGRIFGDDFSWQWIPLYEGINTLSFVGNCTVTVEWREPIKCGEF